jgi:hypothetical protein
MTRYINFKGSHGVETVDQLERSDFSTYKEFKIELNRLLTEYRLAGMSVYISQRQSER